MLTSLDGKIDGDFFRAPETGPAQQAYGSLRGFYRCQATLYGTTTMLGGYADGAVSSLPEEAPESSRQDFINPEGLAWVTLSSPWIPRASWPFTPTS